MMKIRSVLLVTAVCLMYFDAAAQCDNGPFLDATSQPSKCGNFNGSISLSVTGGNGPVFVYLDGTELGDTVTVIDEIPSGFYNLEVIDSAGCTDKLTVYVDNLPGVEITDIEFGYSGCDSVSGSFVDVEVNSIGDVEYSSNGVVFQSESQLTGLPADTITVFVRDEFGCTDERDVFIPSPFPRIIRIQTLESDCQADDGEIWAVYYASWGPYFVSVDNNNYIDGPMIRDLSAGEYTFYVRNELGCVVSFPVSLGGPAGLSPGMVTITPATCGNNNGSISINGAAEIATFMLGNSDSDEGVFRMLAAGEYSLHFIDTLGCERDTILEVPESDCEVYFSNVFSPNGDGVNDIFKPVFRSNPPEDAVLEIADRWGSRVYSCTGACSWDGAADNVMAANGVYVYLFRYRDANGVQRVISGDVTLLR